MPQRAADAAAVQAEVLHRRRLEAAWLHGGDRTAADRTTAWIWLFVGLLIVALVAAGMGIAHAYQAQQRLDQRQRASVAVPWVAPPTRA